MNGVLVYSLILIRSNVFESLRDYFVYSKGQELAKQFRRLASSSVTERNSKYT